MKPGSPNSGNPPLATWYTDSASTVRNSTATSQTAVPQRLEAAHARMQAPGVETDIREAWAGAAAQMSSLFSHMGALADETAFGMLVHVAQFEDKRDAKGSLQLQKIDATRAAYVDGAGENRELRKLRASAFDLCTAEWLVGGLDESVQAKCTENFDALENIFAGRNQLPFRAGMAKLCRYLHEAVPSLKGVPSALSDSTDLWARVAQPTGHSQPQTQPQQNITTATTTTMTVATTTSVTAPIATTPISATSATLPANLTRPLDKDGKKTLAKLFKACVKGNEKDAAKYMGKLGAHIEAPNENGETPLMVALKSKHYGIARKLMVAYSMDGLKAVGPNGATASSLVAASGKDDLGETLRLEIGLRKKNSGQPAIAIGTRATKAAGSPAKVSGIRDDSKDDLECTPIWRACDRGDATALAELLAGGSNARTANMFGVTPLMIAINKGHHQLALDLLPYYDLQALQAVSQSGYTAMGLAAKAEAFALRDAIDDRLTELKAAEYF